ncbi:uncharacterized protein FIBRA_06821 [Fibroporia radiculosa]|uniref:Uncharacterized protein n=1 Tax=Fibroporia radiculosa TaxID=599839 RepID=J4HZQ0_9APHY|nr:uncharacterized protein FIBRA_06821 [Fibroporia radiculosa]CCM04637.1 predicted protein [Fibroporia radiculosa]
MADMLHQLSERLSGAIAALSNSVYTASTFLYRDILLFHWPVDFYSVRFARCCEAMDLSSTVQNNRLSVQGTLRLSVSPTEQFVDSMIHQWARVFSACTAILTIVETISQTVTFGTNPLLFTTAILSIVQACIGMTFSGMYIWFAYEVKEVNRGGQLLQRLRSLEASRWLKPSMLLAAPVVWFLWGAITSSIMIIFSIWDRHILQNAPDNSAQTASLPAAIISGIVITTTAIVGAAHLLLAVSAFWKFPLSREDNNHHEDGTRVDDMQPYLSARLGSEVTD